MEFDCKLATQSNIKRVSGFNSIKELYQRVSQIFLVPINEILFCTLNTHNPKDMSSLLGSHLTLGDLIVVHLLGPQRSLNLTKTQGYLGLTITDNGHGRAFVKKIKSTDGSLERLIQLGDHIAAINSRSTLGLRHFEVAKAIREIPPDTSFSMHLIQPLTNSHLEDRDMIESNNSKVSGTSVSEGQITQDSDNSDACSTNGSSYDDLVNSSLPYGKLLSKSGHSLASLDKVEYRVYRGKIENINSILESFLGIHDNVLAIQIYRLAVDSENSFERFVDAINTSDLNIFSFDREIELYLWEAATKSN